MNEYKIIFSFLLADGYRQQDIDVVKAATPQQAVNWVKDNNCYRHSLAIDHVFSFEQNRWSACIEWN